jgi:hypothetical protein
VPDLQSNALSCLGACGSGDEVSASLPFCRACFTRLPVPHRVMLRAAQDTRDAGLLLYAVTEAFSWIVNNHLGDGDDAD